MKRIHALLVLLVFAIATVWTTVRDYQRAERQITDDLTHALLMTQAEQPVDWLSTDTIRQFRSHIRQPQLRDVAQLSFLLGGDAVAARGPHTQALALAPDRQVHAYGQASLSTFDVWRMGDHRLSLALSLLTLFWMALSLRLTRRSAAPTVYLTPMQEQLVALLLSAPNRELTKQDICDRLWPGKPDASDTLYTLVRRTKQSLSGRSPLRITSVRGRAYRIDGPTS